MDMRVRKPVGHPMPEIAAFVAELKAVFGEPGIDEAIRRGKAGGLRLLHRSTRRVELTEAGEVYFKRCQSIVEEARIAQESLLQRERGRSSSS
jgi:hypothetical protein